jgi:hypothetical protein
MIEQMALRYLFPGVSKLKQQEQYQYTYRLWVACI